MLGENPSLSRGMKDEKSQPDQEERDRLVCIFCTVLPLLDHLKFVCDKLTFYILVFYSRNFIIIISRKLF